MSNFEQLYQERLEMLHRLKRKLQQRNKEKPHLKLWNYRIFLQNVKDRVHDSKAGHSYCPKTKLYRWAFR